MFRQRLASTAPKYDHVLATAEMDIRSSFKNFEGTLSPVARQNLAFQAALIHLDLRTSKLNLAQNVWDKKRIFTSFNTIDLFCTISQQNSSDNDGKIH